MTTFYFRDGFLYNNVPQLIEPVTIAARRRLGIVVTADGKQARSLTSLTCEVCGGPTSGIRCGAFACDSCKNFFIRCRKKPAPLYCITGQGECLSLGKLPVSRPICRKCRLEKCLLIGMRVQQHSSKPAGEILHLGFIDSSTVTATVDLALSASAKLNASFNAMPWSIDPAFHVDDVSLWKYIMVNFHYEINATVDYVKTLHGFSSLAIEDRCRLFTSRHVILLAIHASLPDRNPEMIFFNTQPAFRDHFFKFFPYFAHFLDVLLELASVFKEWNPSCAEVALLQAMSVFRTDTVFQLANFDAVRKEHESLNLALDNFLRKDEKSLRMKRSFFFRAYDILLNKLQRTSETVMSEMVSHRPDLFFSTSLYADVHRVTNPTPSSSVNHQATLNSIHLSEIGHRDSYLTV